MHLDHGYCVTVHSSQGQTCDTVLIDADVSSVTAGESLFYVAISRARSLAAIYTDDASLLPEAMSRSEPRANASTSPSPNLGRLPWLSSARMSASGSDLRTARPFVACDGRAVDKS